MTREEGIEFGLAWLELNEDCESSQTYEFIKMAIKALEQEPCEGCEVGNPCLYCRHEFEPQESEDKG